MKLLNIKPKCSFRWKHKTIYSLSNGFLKYQPHLPHIKSTNKLFVPRVYNLPFLFISRKRESFGIFFPGACKKLGTVYRSIPSYIRSYRNVMVFYKYSPLSHMEMYRSPLFSAVKSDKSSADLTPRHRGALFKS